METLVNLAGAVALLLWGIRTVRTGVERLLGPQIEARVAVLTGRRLSAFGLGATAALALQSGDRGVAYGGQLLRRRGCWRCRRGSRRRWGRRSAPASRVVVLNLDVKLLGPMLLFVGFVVFSASTGRRGKHIGRITLGLAFILTALTLLSAATAALGASPEMGEIMRILATQPLALVVVTALLAWAMHSSIAVVLTIANLVATGGLPHDAALWMVIGANAGAALPPLAAGWALGGRARQLLVGAVRAAPCRGSARRGGPRGTGARRAAAGGVRRLARRSRPRRAESHRTARSAAVRRLDRRPGGETAADRAAGSGAGPGHGPHFPRPRRRRPAADGVSSTSPTKRPASLTSFTT